MLDWLWRKVNTPMYVVMDISDRFIITSVILQNQKDSYKILHRDCIECMGLYGNSSLQIKMLYQNIDLAIKKVESTLNFKIKNIILSISIIDLFFDNSENLESTLIHKSTVSSFGESMQNNIKFKNIYCKNEVILIFNQIFEKLNIKIEYIGYGPYMWTFAMSILLESMVTTVHVDLKNTIAISNYDHFLINFDNIDLGYSEYIYQYSKLTNQSVVRSEIALLQNSSDSIKNMVITNKNKDDISAYNGFIKKITTIISQYNSCNYIILSGSIFNFPSIVNAVTSTKKGKIFCINDIKFLKNYGISSHNVLSLFFFKLTTKNENFIVKKIQNILF